MSEAADRVASQPAVETVRAALAGDQGEVWVVGGTIRDVLLGRSVHDVDLVVRGDPERVARAVRSAAGRAVFQLSEAFGAWRAIERDSRWVWDVSPLHGDTIEEDLARRDFTVNAMALPLAGGELIDPHDGLRDLRSRTLRVIGGPGLASSAYADDPLRPLRLVRLATELSLAPDEQTERLTREAAPRLREASPERVFAELRRIVVSERVLEGLGLSDHLGVTGIVLPELKALQGVEQSHFHHLDVYDHTIEVLRRELELEGALDEAFGELAPRVGAVLDEPLADELTRREALRFGALLHDVGKPATRSVRPDGRVTFIGHDLLGEEMVADIGRRLRVSERLREFLGKLARHHLALGFLVHERPLGRDAIYRYLSACDPVEVEVTLLSCADRLATRGKDAEAAIAAHFEVARELMAHALDWREQGPPKPPLRGDELAEELGIAPGPELGSLLARLREARFTGEACTREEAVDLARRLRDNSAR
jgi:poly(A) polymerase